MRVSSCARREADAAAVRPWLELLDTGNFSARTLAEVPRSFLVDAHWAAVLATSAAAAAPGGATWLHEFHLGNHHAERRNYPLAAAHWQASLAVGGAAM